MPKILYAAKGDSRSPRSTSSQLNAAFLLLSKEKTGRDLWAGLERAGYLVIENGSVMQNLFCKGGSHYPCVSSLLLSAQTE